MEKFEGKLLWNGRTYVTVTNYSECERETLYRTQSGKWKLHIVSICQKDKSGQWKELTKTEAAKWLVINGYEPHPDVAEEYLSFRIDSAYYKYHPQYQRKTLKARQRVALTDGTGRWFDLADAVRTNIFSKPDIVWNKEKTAYFYVETYAVKGIPVVHFWWWTDKESTHRWFLKRDIQNDFSFYDEELFKELYNKLQYRKE